MKPFRISILICVFLCPCFVSVAQIFEPEWDSLKQYSTSEWNKDAKFGIFIHWGPYAVPAAGSEWYPRRMYQEQDWLFDHHKENWGDHLSFGYKDFIPLFTAENFDAEAWVDLFARSGARYVVPVAEHCDGFAMYDSSHTKWNAVSMGPKRDVAGELAAEVRKKGLKFGLSSHYAWNWRYFTYRDDFDTANPDYASLYAPRHEPDEPATEEFIAHWKARTIEIIDTYQPDLLWFDIGICYPEFEQGRKEIAAYYYNKGIEWDTGVVLNYKRWTKPEEGVVEVAFPEGAGTLDLEREKLPRIREFFWQTDTSVSTKSWGYIEDDEFKSVNSLIDDLVDIVSKNGCLLLNIGPRADGTIPEEVEEILLAMGEWLDFNGEAIYETRPWKLYGEGPTGTAEGHLSENQNQSYTAEDIRFTTNGDWLYIIALEWPENGTLVVKSLHDQNEHLVGIDSIEMLGTDQAISWTQSSDGLVVQLPTKKPGDYAYVLKAGL